MCRAVPRAIVGEAVRGRGWAVVGVAVCAGVDGVAIGGEVGVVVPMGMVAVGMAGVVFVVVFVVVGVVVGVVRDVGVVVVTAERKDRSSSSSGGPFARDVLFFSSSQWFAMGVVSRSKEEASKKGWLQLCVLTGWGYRPRPHARTFGTVCGTGGAAATAGGGRRPAGAGGQIGGGACVAGGVAERSSAAVGTWWHVGRFHGARPSAVGSPRWWARRAGI